jgi:LacI family transcriptional regulator
MPELRLEDIARQAGVSRSTVSRVVNDHPNVKDDVRKRVQDVIQLTGYHPNAAARTLASQRSWTIGLVLPQSISSFFTDPYFPHLTKGIAQACNQYDYTFALFLAGSKEDEEKIFPRVSRKGLLDGVIVQAGNRGDQGIINRLASSNIPAVMVGRPFHSENISFINVDNVKGAHDAVSHLAKLGYRRIGTICGPAHSSVSADRLNGYRSALTEHGQIVNESLIVEGDFTESGGYAAMQKLLLGHPEAVFAASDVMAMGAIRAIREAGLNIPDDVAIVGFDDLPMPAHLGIGLTTIRQPVVTFGEKAVEILIDLIENGIHPPQQVIMSTELIVRESCGASRREKTSA